MTSFNYRIYYEDTDAGGVVYYANYLKFFERARTDYLRHLGISQNALANQENIAFVVRRCEVDYLAPARLDDQINVSVKIINLGSASMMMEQEIFIAQRSISKLKVELVCINKLSFRPAKIPPIIKNLINV